MSSACVLATSLCDLTHHDRHPLQITWASSLLVLPPPLLFQAIEVCSVRMLVHTLPGTLRVLLSVFILSVISTGFHVSPGSPCSSQCTIDGAVDTNTSDIVCSDTDFSATSTGLKFKNCIECLQTSRQFSGSDSDVSWFLCKLACPTYQRPAERLTYIKDNLRFAADVCLFRYPGADEENDTSACDVDYVCKPLQNALEEDELSTTSGSELGYCTADNSTFRGQARTTCIGCLQGSPNNKYLSNCKIFGACSYGMYDFC